MCIDKVEIDNESKNYNPVAEAYKILTDVFYKIDNPDINNKETIFAIAIEEAIGYLGEALDK